MTKLHTKPKFHAALKTLARPKELGVRKLLGLIKSPTVLLSSKYSSDQTFQVLLSSLLSTAHTAPAPETCTAALRTARPTPLRADPPGQPVGAPRQIPAGLYLGATLRSPPAALWGAPGAHGRCPGQVRPPPLTRALTRRRARSPPQPLPPSALPTTARSNRRSSRPGRREGAAQRGYSPTRLASSGNSPPGSAPAAAPRWGRASQRREAVRLLRSFGCGVPGAPGETEAFGARQVVSAVGGELADRPHPEGGGKRLIFKLGCHSFQMSALNTTIVFLSS